MKNTLVAYFTFLLSILFCTSIYAQNPSITPLNNSFTFPDQLLEQHNVAYRANSINCNFSFTRYYKYYSFKAGFDMAFAFDLIADKPDFKFLIWKLPANSDPASIFTNNTTILPARTVQGATNIKGLKEGDVHICEDGLTPNADGYANGFSGNEQLLKDEVVVIAIYGNTITDKFDLKINVAEERTLDFFNFKCLGDSYSYDEIINKLFSDSSYQNVELFSDQNFTQIINPGTNFTALNQTIYAQVKDENNKLKYIYTIPLSLRPQSDFSDFFLMQNSNLRIINTCENTFIWRGKDWYLNDYLNLTNPTDYDILQIRYIDQNGQEQIVSNPEVEHIFTIPTNATLSLQVLTKSVNPLMCDNQSEISLSITNTTLAINESYTINACDGDVISKAQILNTLFPNGSSNFELETNFENQFTLNFGASNEIVLPIRVKYGNECYTNTSQFIIRKTNPINIIDASINGCLADLNQNLIDAKIEEIKNGTQAVLNFYFDGNLIPENDLLELIRSNRNGAITIVVAEGCTTTKTLTFLLVESSIILQDNEFIYQEFCVNPDLNLTFQNSQLQEIAFSNLDMPNTTLTDYTFLFFDENENPISSINNLQNERRIKVVAKLNSENCFKEFFITFRRINQLIIDDANQQLTANCDDTIILTREILIDLFGAEVANYQTSVLLNQSIRLNFDQSNQATLSIDFYTSEGCVTTKEIIINKGTNLSVQLGTIEQEVAENPYRFCGEINSSDLEVYLSGYIQQIINNNPTIRTEKSISQYAQEMIANSGNVEVILYDPNQCGTKSINFYYQQYPSDILSIENQYYTCTDQEYQLDLSNYANVKVTRLDGTLIMPNQNIYNLSIGSYRVEITNEFGCVTAKEIEILNSPNPIINEVVITSESFKIIATGNGGELEYSIDGINWQTSNLFDNIRKGENYTVYVRENGCATVSLSNVVYLNLPNFISPNGDGINDIWKPIGVNTTLDVRIQIFNRYGNVVYQNEGPNALNWNGKVNQKPLAPDSYWYIIEYIDTRAVIKLKYQGYITIKSSK